MFSVSNSVCAIELFEEEEIKSSGVDLFDEVDEECIAEVLSVWTGIPVYKLTEEETQKLLHMEDDLHKRVIGQEDAIHAVSQAIRRTRAGLKDPKRPSGSFVFLGPSGVGKTELAKTLAEFLFGDEQALISLLRWLVYLEMKVFPLVTTQNSQCLNSTKLTRITRT